MAQEPLPQEEAGAPKRGDRMRSYRTEAIVLRAVAVREADRLVTVLTPERGKLALTVRGARRITSRLGGHLDVLNRVDLTLAQGHRFDVVTGAESMESFRALKADLDPLAAALYVAELIDALMPEASPHPQGYVVLLSALRALEGGADVALVTRYAELRLLEAAGYLPELARCVVCGNEVKAEHHRFAPVMGGVVCDTCQVSHGALLPLSVDTLKVLRYFAREGLGKALRLSLPPSTADQLEAVLGASVHQALDREVMASTFIEHLRRLKRRPPASAMP